MTTEEYEVEEIYLSDKEIDNLIKQLQDLYGGDHIHLQINKNKEIIIHKK